MTAEPTVEIPACGIFLLLGPSEDFAPPAAWFGSSKAARAVGPLAGPLLLELVQNSEIPLLAIQCGQGTFLLALNPLLDRRE